MAFEVILYQMRKDKNSTKRPTGPGNPYMVELKDQCSVVDPVLVFNFGQHDYPSGFNYVNIPIFENRCYWITNWQYFRGLWTATCHVDALASWRADIGNSTQYVTRAASRYNRRVTDTVYPILSNAGYSTASFLEPQPFTDNTTSGRYIVGVVTGGVRSFGAITYYNMSQQAFWELLDYMLKSTDWLQLNPEEISGDLAKTLFNPFQYMVSCIYMPYDFPSDSAGITSKVRYGWWEFDLENSVYVLGLSDRLSDITYHVLIPKHPDTDIGDYVYAEPYSRYTLYFPPFGMMPIDGSALVNADQLYCRVLVDGFTGTGYLYVSTDDPADYPGGADAREIVAYRQAQVGVSVPLAQLSTAPISGIGDVVQGGIAGIYGAAIGFMSTAADRLTGKSSSASSTMLKNVNGIGDAIISSSTELNVIGKTGTLAEYHAQPFFMLRYMRLAEQDNEHKGRPLCERAQISTLPGFITCSQPHIECHATADEIGEIESAMSSGFYWE